MQRPEIDKERLEQVAGNLFGKIEGAFSVALGFVGDRLGLYRSLADAGPASSEELAERTGLKERWVREWLYQQTAAGVLDHADGRFSLSNEAAELFSREESPFFRSRLVPEVLPSLDGVVAKLEAGARVADVGCGAGVAAIEMAKAFPASEFHGYDNSRVALGRSAALREDAGVSNVTFHDTTHRRLEEDASYDFITTFDCIHDMTHPVETIGAIRRSLKADGTWFVSDIHGHPTFEANLAELPLAGMMYGFSVTCCMRSALSTPDGAGLGTLGFTEIVARRVAEEAGFSRFVKHDFENPLNDYYEVRP